MGPHRVLVGALVALSALASGVLGDEACSGHGSLVDGKCVCSTPLPTDDVPGWVGDQCSTQVHRLSLDSKDVQEVCGSGHTCNIVTPSDPVCFSASIDEVATTAFHLNLLLSSNSVDATVVLNGLLTNFSATADPGGGAPHVVPQAYPNSETAYSFSVRTGTGGSPTAQLKLTRRQLGYGAYTGMFVCASSNGTTTLGLRAATNSCPFDLKTDGTVQLCSGRGTSDGCPHGICTCPPPYAPPPNWVIAPGLGFEDCSASLMPLQPSVPMTVPELAPGGWAFFKIELLDTLGYELRVWAAASEATKGSLVLYLRHLQPPGSSADQHDLSSDSPVSPHPASWWLDQSAHLTLRRKDPAFQPGMWYLGVLNRGLGPVSFSVGAALYDCPNNCSGRGTCNAATMECTCSEPVSPVSSDCSIALRELALGQPLAVSPRDFTYDELVLRGVGDKLRASGGARLALTASFTTTDPDATGVPAWVAGRPAVFAAPSLEAALNQTGAGEDGGSHPLHPKGAIESLALAAPGVEYFMTLGPWTVGDDGSLHVLVWNPLSSPLRQVGYNLTVVLQAECPAGCSGHGTCDTATGECKCQEPYLGTDCSVDASTISCAPGSHRAVRRDGVRGTCWVPCKPDGRGFEDQSCDDLQCDGPGDGHGQLRRKGSEVECVEDQCAAGNYTLTDPSGDFVCTRRCYCPADGGACSMEADCLPGTRQCLKGLQLAADGEKCVAAPCVEGSLKKGYQVDGGSAFAVCLCATAGDPSSCAFTTPTQASGNADGVVSCLPGFERQGATSSRSLSDGGSLVVGGKCGRPRRRGASGGMVFFYCLLSIVLAAGLVVGGKYGILWYEQYRYGKSVFSQGYVSWPLFGNRGNAGAGTDDW